MLIETSYTKSFSELNGSLDLIKSRKKRQGFSPEDEMRFLGRLDNNVRIANLNLELSTQLAEDFGLVEFSKKYVIRNEQIVDAASGQNVVELTSRGGISEETQAIKAIENGLLRENQQTMIHFSPKNEELGYDQNCVDFWRSTEDGEIVWNRLVVGNDFEEMKEIYQLVSGEEVFNKMEILAKPVSTNLKLTELFSLFRMSHKKSQVAYEEIDKTVKQIISQFEKQFGRTIAEDKDLILRLYSAAYDYMSEPRAEEREIRRRNTDNSNFDAGLFNYMFAPMTGTRVEMSFGCAGTTIVGKFGEKYGYYVTDGKVSFGMIPEGMKQCKQCGCYYSGDKCPFC